MASHDPSAMDEPNSPGSSNQEASFTVSPDSSMQANGDEHHPRAEDRERHPKGRRKRTKYVKLVAFEAAPGQPGGQLKSALKLVIVLTDILPFNHSAKDRAVLEDAYSKNSKPDKNARLDIVNRVSLNEKEVQVSH